jgi:hypothetical protein
MAVMLQEKKLGYAADMELTQAELTAIAGLMIATVAFTVLYGRMLFSSEQRLNVVGLIVLVGSIAAAILLI